MKIYFISIGKLKVQIRHLLISQDLLYWTQVTRNNFGDLSISMSYGYPVKLRIYCMMVFLYSYVVEQYLYTNISKYGVLECTSSMNVLQERSFIIDHIDVISWDMKLLQEFFSKGSQINLLLSIEAIMFGLMNIILVSPYKTSTL